MAVTKARIVEMVAAENGRTKNESFEYVEQLIEVMKDALAAGEDILVSGFGRFNVREKRERRGRNPATGTAMHLAPRRVVTFRCSGVLRNRINGG